MGDWYRLSAAPVSMSDFLVIFPANSWSARSDTRYYAPGPASGAQRRFGWN